jgi:drug/metabolite transporter (DMT)-like permease
VVAIVAGLAAAVCWTVTTLAASRSSRLVGPLRSLAWVMLIGFVVVLPFAIASTAPTGSARWWLLGAGAGNVMGLLLEYQAVRIGNVGVVAPIASTEGAVTALIAVAAGEPMSTATGACLAVIATGVVLAALEDAGSAGHPVRTGPSVALALGAALAFGLGLYAAGHVSGSVSLAWLVLPARLVGVTVLAAPLALARRVRITREAIPFVTAAGLAEVAGYCAFAIGARHSIGVTSVLGSQFAAFSAIAAHFVFGERLRGIQVVGVVAIVAGVSALAIVG